MASFSSTVVYSFSDNEWEQALWAGHFDEAILLQPYWFWSGDYLLKNSCLQNVVIIDMGYISKQHKGEVVKS